jgi:phosphoribosylaminoimidazole (AIR) synthetase
LLKTLNCGIGLCLVISSEDVEESKRIIESHGYKAIEMGQVVESGQEKPSWRGLENGLS